MDQKTDPVLIAIADYVANQTHFSNEAYETARICLADSLGCAMLALNFPKCTALLGPVVEGTQVPNGTHVPGTSHIVDPVCGAFNIGTMIRWLDFNDTWLAAEWGHPSDNIGGILALADHLSRKAVTAGTSPLLVSDVLTAMIKAHEIQGVLALSNSFNRVGIDHVILVKVATAAVATAMLGGSRDQIIDTLSNAWIDTGSLRTYRHAPNTGSRKSWAAGDATARGVFLALLTMKGEMGYRTALSTPQWGFSDVIFNHQPITLSRPLGAYVMENILFKVAFPAEFHAQTAVECAIKLHPLVKNRLDEIAKIEIETHESAIRIIDKRGPLKNPADRDHCLQYMIAVPLIKGSLTAHDYEEEASRDPRIDILRDKMVIVENKSYSRDYLDPDKRSIANSITIYFKDNSKTEKIEVEYPYGHRKRRKEALPLLLDKLQKNLRTRLTEDRVETLLDLFENYDKLYKTAVLDLLNLFN